jgi:hypothetical protein
MKRIILIFCILVLYAESQAQYEFRDTDTSYLAARKLNITDSAGTATPYYATPTSAATSAGDSVRTHAITTDACSTGYYIYQSATGVFSYVPNGHKSTINWTLDSTALATYTSRFNRTWFRTWGDSLVVDTIGGVVQGTTGDSATIRILWGQSRGTAIDSCADLKITSFTTGTTVAGTKTIPPEMYVWVKLTTKAGSPLELFFYIDVSRKWY